VYVPVPMGTVLVVQLNSSPKNPCAFAVSFEMYSNQQKRSLGNVMVSSFARWSNEPGPDRQRPAEFRNPA
jgi:hypothetical protein